MMENQVGENGGLFLGCPLGETALTSCFIYHHYLLTPDELSHFANDQNFFPSCYEPCT